MTQVIQQTVGTTTYTCNSIKYEMRTYNGFSVMIRTDNRYFNATMLCHQICKIEGKRVKEFYNLKRSPQFLDYMQFVANEGSPQFEGTSDVMILISGRGVLNEVRGYYLHPAMMNCILTLTSIKYLDTVSHIMDTINDYTHAANTTFDAVKDELITQYRIKIDELQKQNMRLEATQDALSTTVYTTSTRTPGKLKDLWIIDSVWGKQLSADSTTAPDAFYYHYQFPASMNVKQLIREHFKSDIQTHYIIPDAVLDNVVAYIEALNPLLSE